MTVAARLFAAALVGMYAITGAMMTRRQWNSLFKSDASVFSSDEDFHDAHKTLHQLDAGSTRRHHGPHRSSFIVQLADCGSACHKALAEVAGKGKLWRRTDDVVQLVSTPAAMRAVKTGSLAPHVVDYFQLHPKLKFESIVSGRITECSQSSDAAQIKFIITIIPLPEAELSAFMASLRTLPGTLSSDPVHADTTTLTTLTVPCASAEAVLQALSEHSEVEWIEELGEYVASNRWGRGLCQSGDPDSQPIFFANITGQGQIVGISDTGLDMESCYFKDDDVAPPFDIVDYSHRKVVHYNTYNDNSDDTITGHGTHVSGSAAGKSNQDYGSFALYNGNAPEAKIAFFDIGDSNGAIQTPSDLDLDLFQVLYDAGARVMTNSWGLQVVDANGNYFPSRNAYTSHARAVDKFMVRNPDALVLFSAGNYGDLHDGNTVTAPSTNKNGLSVGASLSDNDAFKSYLGADAAKSSFNPTGVAYFSGVGPTQDNRLKPDIVSPGFPLYSAAVSAECGVKALQGTSMSSPTAAGIAMLVREYFTAGFYPGGFRKESDGFIPSGALLKAMLVHSSRMMTSIVDSSGSTESLTEYPSNYQGYGRITIDSVLNFGQAAESDYLSLFVRGGATSADKYYVSFQAQGEEHNYIFMTGPDISQHPIRISVVYTDELPGSSANTADVNYISVVATNVNTSETYSPLSAGSSTSNNVIVIDITSPPANTTFNVAVTCLSFLSTDQPYAIVMTGEVSTSDSLPSNQTDPESFSHSGSGLTSSLLTSIWILVGACLILVLSIFSMHRENVVGEKKNIRRKKRNSTMYKGV